MKDEDLLILKVPQVICARKVRRGGKLVENEDYLNSEVFTKQFYKPAIEILGSNLGGFIFEQEYHPKNDRFSLNELAESLNTFFAKIPRDTRYHIELRTEAYLADPVFEILKSMVSVWCFPIGPGSLPFQSSSRKRGEGSSIRETLALCVLSLPFE